MIAKDHFYHHPAPNELTGIFCHYIFARIAPISCKLDSYHCNCITPSSSWGTRGMAERMERNGQRMIAKDHFYYHPAPNEMWTRTFFSNTAVKKALFFLQIVLKEWSVNNPIRFTAYESTFRRNGQQCSKFGRQTTFSISSIPKVNTNICFQYSSEKSSIFFANCPERMIC